MKRWQAGLIIIAVTFVVTLTFIVVTAQALDLAISDQIRLPMLIVASVVGLLGSIAFVVVAFSLFGLINGAEPLGLPEGSVRALIALLILVIFASMTVFFFGALKGTPKDVDNSAAFDLAKQVLTILGTLLTAISSFYFGSQAATSAATRVASAASGGNGGASTRGASRGAAPSPPPDDATGAGVTPHAHHGTTPAP